MSRRSTSSRGSSVDTVNEWAPADVFPDDWDRDGLLTALGEYFPVTSTVDDIAGIGEPEQLGDRLVAEAAAAYEAKEAAVGEEVMRELERVVLLNITDTKWREHLYEMDYLQEGIHLRAYAQRDPLVEYQREAFEMFQALTASIQEDFVQVHLPGRARAPGAAGAGAAGAATAREPRRGRLRCRGGRARHRWAAATPARRRPATRTKRSATRRRATRRARAAAGKKYKKCHGAVRRDVT